MQIYVNRAGKCVSRIFTTSSRIENEMALCNQIQPRILSFQKRDRKYFKETTFSKFLHADMTLCTKFCFRISVIELLQMYNLNQKLHIGKNWNRSL